MAGKDWLGTRRAEVAADRILDAAGELFAHNDVSSVGMNEIAHAAGCSRATLYRYFENRRRCTPPTCTARPTGCTNT